MPSLTVTILDFPFIGVVYEDEQQIVSTICEHEDLTKWLDAYISPILLSRSDWILNVKIIEETPNGISEFPETEF